MQGQDALCFPLLEKLSLPEKGKVQGQDASFPSLEEGGKGQGFLFLSLEKSKAEGSLLYSLEEERMSKGRALPSSLEEESRGQGFLLKKNARGQDSLLLSLPVAVQTH